jgi:hypothetical protein
MIQSSGILGREKKHQLKASRYPWVSSFGLFSKGSGSAAIGDGRVLPWDWWLWAEDSGVVATWNPNRKLSITLQTCSMQKYHTGCPETPTHKISKTMASQLHMTNCNYSSRVITLAEVSAAAAVAFFPRSIWTDIFAWLKSTPELCNARVKVSNNLPHSECNHLRKCAYRLWTEFIALMT